MTDDEFQKKYLKQVVPQLLMNEKTWDALKQNGVTEDMVLQPDFTFVSKDEKKISELKKHLEKNNCRNLKITKTGLIIKNWEIKGQSSPVKLTEDLLDEWVRWLVVQGIKFDCEFDGWGVLLSK